MNSKPPFTVGDLRAQLKLYPDDYELIFGGGDLTFYRTKPRGPELVQIEFYERYEIAPFNRKDD